MVAVPPAIIFVNDDLTKEVLGVVQRQLQINETIDGYEFDDRVAAEPNYPAIIHQLNLRLLVIRPFTELENRDKADVVVFMKAGLASVEKNKFGPPRETFPIKKLYWGQLRVFGVPRLRRA